LERERAHERANLEGAQRRASIVAGVGIGDSRTGELTIAIDLADLPPSQAFQAIDDEKDVKAALGNSAAAAKLYAQTGLVLCLDCAHPKAKAPFAKVEEPDDVEALVYYRERVPAQINVFAVTDDTKGGAAAKF